MECLVSFGKTQQLIQREVLDCDIKPIVGVPFFTSVNPVIDWAKQDITYHKGSRVVNFEVVPIDDGAHVEEVMLR